MAEDTQKDSKSALVPKRRFPDFRDALGWTPVSLREASVPVTERVGDRKLTPVSISAGVGFVPQTEKFGRDISGNQYPLYTLVSDGDFVYNKGNSLKFPQGCVYLLQNLGQVAAPNVFICFRLKVGYSNGFFQNCFESNFHGEQLKKHITSGARSNGLLNISKENFFGVEIPTPSLAEQKRIADCLSSLDELIAAQVRKVKALKIHKIGLIEQLFPREGQTHPRLRLPEFRDAEAWLANTLGNLVEIRSGNSPSHYELVQDGKYPFVKVEDLNNCETYQLKAREYSNDPDGLVPSSSVIFPKRGAAIALNKVRLSGRELLMDTNMMALTPNAGYRADFLFHYLSQIGLNRIADNSTIPQINNKHIIPFRVRVPLPTEQHRIANFLTSLDDLIAAQTLELDAVKAHKKGLMQQLLPSAEAIEA